MYLSGYTPKKAAQDFLVFLAYRVNHPEAAPTDDLLAAEARLQDLNSRELLDVAGSALRSGIRPGIARVGSEVQDPFKDKRGRF